MGSQRYRNVSRYQSSNFGFLESRTKHLQVADSITPSSSGKSLTNERSHRGSRKYLDLPESRELQKKLSNSLSKPILNEVIEENDSQLFDTTVKLREPIIGPDA